MSTDLNNDGLRNRSRNRSKNLSESESKTYVRTDSVESSTLQPAPATEAVATASSDPSAATEELDKNILVLIKEYGRTVLILMVAWLVGYFNFSATWLMVGLFVFMWRQQRRIRATFRDQIQQRAALLDERTAISRVARVEDLPSWVYFPDVERAEWLNKIVKQLWPYIGDYVQNLLKESIEPMIQTMIKDYGLESFTFGKVSLGDVAPRIGGMKVYTENVKRDEIIMDVEIFYAGDAEISVTLKKLGIPITAGLKNMKLHGTMRCEMKPLCKQIPLVGALTCFFLYNPTVDFDLTNLANLLDAPVLSATLHHIISDFIAQLMVLPNRFPIQLIESINTTLLNYPLPKGVLRIHVVEASDLKKSDTFGKSDPYVNVKVGAQISTTRVVKKDLNPRWDEVFEFVVDEISGQMLEVEVFDKDDGDKDDFLGRYDLDVEKMARMGYMDDWLTLDQIKKGKIHVRTLWLNFSLDQAHIKKLPILPKSDAVDTVGRPGLDPLIESDIQRSGSVGEKVKSTEKLSCAFLMVHLDSAKNLPMGKKAKSDPSPRAHLTVKGGGTSSFQQSDVKYKTQDPRWEKGFKFLIHNPEIQDLVVAVVDTDDKDHLMGEYTFHINELLKEEDMLMDARPFYITNNATITMRLCLRILHAGALAVDTPAVGDVEPEKENSPEDPEESLFTNLKDEDEPVAPNSAPASSPRVAEETPQAGPATHVETSSQRPGVSSEDARYRSVGAERGHRLNGAEMRSAKIDADFRPATPRARPDVVPASESAKMATPHGISVKQQQLRQQQLQPAQQPTPKLPSPQTDKDISTSFQRRLSEIEAAERRNRESAAANGYLHVPAKMEKSKSKSKTSLFNFGSLKRNKSKSKRGSLINLSQTLPSSDFSTNKRLPGEDDDDVAREIGGARDLIDRDKDKNGTRNREDDDDSVMTTNSISESISGISDVKNRYRISHGKETYDSDGEEDLGRVRLTLRHSAQRNVLVVVVHQCTHLIRCDKKGNTDPYVRLYLLPDRSKYGKKKTTVKEDTLNPIYDETFEFDISLEEAERRVLDLCVKNDCSVFSREKKEIGKCFIRLNDFQLSQASTRWFDLCDPSNAKS